MEEDEKEDNTTDRDDDISLDDDDVVDDDYQLDTSPTYVVKLILETSEFEEKDAIILLYFKPMSFVDQMPKSLSSIGELHECSVNFNCRTSQASHKITSTTIKGSVIDDTTILVTQKCLLSFQCGKYRDAVLCDVVPMLVTHILLSCPCLYDRNVHYNGKENTYSFSKEKQDIFLESMSTKNIRNFKANKTTKIAMGNQKKQLHLLSRMQFEAKNKETKVVYTIVNREMKQPLVCSTKRTPPEVTILMHDFFNIAPLDLPNGLPLLHSIQHAIDLVPGSQLHNLPIYNISQVNMLSLRDKLMNYSVKSLYEKV